MNLLPLFLIGAGTVRAVLGWVENSLEDGEIQDFEWRELGGTLVRTGLLGTVAYFIPGLNMSGLEAAASGLAGDFVLMAVKKLRN